MTDATPITEEVRRKYGEIATGAPTRAVDLPPADAAINIRSPVASMPARNSARCRLRL